MLTPPHWLEGWDTYEVYALTGEGSAIQLNGRELKLSAAGELPGISGKAGSGDVQFHAMSYGFIVFPMAAAAACSSSSGDVHV